MIESMTGFGRVEKEVFDKKITIEIRSLNSKHLDINIRLPSIYSHKEWFLRKRASTFFKKGKIDINFHLQSIGSSPKYFLNTEIIRFYIESFKEIAPGFEEINYLSLAMKMPEVLSIPNKTLHEQDWDFIKCLFDDVFSSTKEARKEEGKILNDDILYRIKNILYFLHQIFPFEKQRKKIIEKRIQKAFHSQNISLDQSRFEQELIFFLEKIDITEELVRLKKHCEYFIQVINLEESQGRKLNFVIQEISREINTLGAKSQHIEIQRFTILIKEEVEKIREQLANVI